MLRIDKLFANVVKQILVFREASQLKDVALSV